MTLIRPYSLLISFIIACLYATNLQASNGWSGSIGTEFQAYRHAAPFDQQHQYYRSIILKPEYVDEWNDGKHLIQFSAFARLSNNNSNQNHMDIRELYWSYVSDMWELRTGIRKVFWGVTESQHLVDIINQTDIVEGFDGEEKIGQPMINVASIHDWGTLDFFLLPSFQPRRYPSNDARLRPPFLISNDNATYDASLEKKHIDVALRYSHYLGDWDFGVSHFYGNSREPRISAPTFTPHYDLIHQTGVDIQATFETWLWKFEGIQRSGMGDRYFATTFGAEYTFFDLFESGADIGIVSEWLYDSRGDSATTAFENDTMIAMRIALNDTQSSEALFGVIFDNEGDGNIATLEASRRLGESFKASINGYLFFSANSLNEPLHFLQKDDHLTLEIFYFF